MKCPICSSTSLGINVRFTSQVACSFSSDNDFRLIEGVELDSEWNDGSPCACLNCNWKGTVRAARLGKPTDVISESNEFESVTKEELQELKRLLAVEDCSPRIREQVQKMMGEVERMGSILEMLARVTDKPTVDDDTFIG